MECMWVADYSINYLNSKTLQNTTINIGHKYCYVDMTRGKQQQNMHKI